MKPQKKDVAQQITDAIIERLEAGTKPWQRLWSGGPCSRPLRVCGTPYRGINCLLLWLIAADKGYDASNWMTFAQAQKLGGQVRKGEKASPAIFYKVLAPAEKDSSDDEDGEGRGKRRVMKSYNIFNADQIDGLPERFYDKAEQTKTEPYDDEVRVRAYLETIPITVHHGGGRAFFSINGDFIQMPDPERFKSFPHYAATRAHELVHATGHKSRLDRTFGKRFGDKAYAMEELVAETGSAILGAELGLPDFMLDGHASYLASWLKILKEDKNAILTAAARAEEAVEMLNNMAAGGNDAKITASESMEMADA